MNNQMQATDMMASSNEMSYVGSAVLHRIPQKGGRPNVFEGTELAMAMSFTPGMPYWYEINIYRTSDQRFVVAIRKFFQSETEKDLHNSWSFSNIAEAVDHIEHYDPSNDLRIPMLDMDTASAAELASMAMSLKAEVEAARLHYAGLVGELFAEVESAGVKFD